MTPGADSAFFPTIARRRLGFVGVRADTNMWSVGIDLETGLAQGQPRRLTRGGGFVSSSACRATGIRSHTSLRDREGLNHASET